MAAERRVLALLARGPDVIVAPLHGREEVADFLGRILQIGVERDDAAAAAMLEAGHDRHVLAEIAAEQDHARDLGPALELLAQQSRAVCAAIVDEYDFVADAGLSRAG